MIYCEFYVELFYIHSEHTQLSTAGAQYIVSGSWKHKLSFHALRDIQNVQSTGISDVDDMYKY